MRAARSFLRGLFRGVSERFLLIWTLADKDSEYFSSAEKAAKYAAKKSSVSDVYVGAGFFKRTPVNGRGRLEDIDTITSFWADIDFQHPVHRKSALLPSKLEAQELIRATGLTPTYIIFTGHGYQAWWMFKKPWHLDSSDERNRAVAFSKRWAEHVKDVAAVKGFAVDNVGDLTRVMRVPGTINRKKKPYRDVKIIASNLDSRFAREDFQKLFKAKTLTVGGSTFSRDDAALLRKALTAKNGEKFSSLWRGDTSGHGEDHSAADLALCNILAHWTNGDTSRIDKLFRQSGLFREKWDEKHASDGRTYGEMTIQKAGGGQESGDNTGGSQMDKLLILASQAELFRDANKDAYATIPTKPFPLTCMLKSAEFKDWLAYEFYENHKKPMRDAAFREALGVLLHRARHDGPEREVSIRVAHADGAIYIDIGDSTGRVIKVTKQGWEIIPSPPVKFIRPRGMQAIPIPEKGGSLDTLKQLINLSPRQCALLLTWMTSALHPHGPFAVLLVTGEQGSGKSTLIRTILALLDAKKAGLRALPRDERDLIIAAHNNWLVAFDNVSYINEWISDAICRLATGGGFGTRLLYQNDVEAIFEAKRPVLVNGIGNLISRGDLLDRALSVHLSRLKDESRISEELYWRNFKKVKGKLLGLILTGLSAVLRNRGKIQPRQKYRMHDFVEIAVAAEEALGFPRGTFEKAYKSCRAGIHHTALDASPIGPYVLNLMMQERQFTGTATKLLRRLNGLLETGHKPRGWPTLPHVLSAQLKRIQPNLRELGVDVDYGKAGNDRFIHLRRSIRKTASDVSEASDGRSGRRRRKFADPTHHKPKSRRGA